MSEQPMAFEEVPGSRTTQQAIDQPQRERIAYEDLRPGDKIQPGDEWKNGDGRWQPYVCLTGLLQFVQDGHAARRPHRVNTIIIDALADAHAATAQLQNERDEARAAIAQVKAEFNSQADVLAEVRGALAAEQRAHKVTMTSGLQACKERDEARAERDRLQEVVGNLYSEPTARQVQDTLRTWATELDWSVGCFNSVGREQIDTIQKTLVAVIERIEGMVNPEGGTDGE